MLSLSAGGGMIMRSDWDRLRAQKDNTMGKLRDGMSEIQGTVDDHLRQIYDEQRRVTKLSGQAGMVINQIDRDFKEKTKLSNSDIVFLFLCAALQCARQYLLPNNVFRLTAHQGDRLVAGLIPKSHQEILLSSVPYDAVDHTPGFETGLSGTTHRYRTLGHDPVLGWVFGTANILTDSLTKSDIITTYAVKPPVIIGPYPGGTPGMFASTYSAVQNDPAALPVALARQAIHFGSDYFTKQSLPIPLLGTLSPEAAHRFMNTSFKNCPSIDMFSITRQAALSALINQIIYYLHRLFYDEGRDGSPTLYEVRTRKILSYSNAIATGSNVIAAAVTGSLNKLDVGGALVTIYRLVSDYKFINEVKRDFLKKELYCQVVGDPYDFMRRN